MIIINDISALISRKRWENLKRGTGVKSKPFFNAINRLNISGLHFQMCL